MWQASAIAAAAIAVVVLIMSVAYAPKSAIVDIVNEGTTPDEAKFEPEDLAIGSGTTVVWKNTDTSAHTVTSRDQGIFDSGVMGPGGEFEFTFNESGAFEYYCKIHPVMAGTVAVS